MGVVMPVPSVVLRTGDEYQRFLENPWGRDLRVLDRAAGIAGQACRDLSCRVRLERAMTVDHVDLMDPKAFVDGIPHDYFRELRRTPGLTLATDAEGYDFWYVVRHAEVVAVSRDTAVFSSSPSTMTSVRQTSSGLPIITFMDGQEHSRLRKLTFKGFTPARMLALEGPVREIVDSLLAEMSARDEFDLADDVALRLPLEVLAELIGIPHDERAEVIAAASKTVNLGDPGYDKSTAETGAAGFQFLTEYFTDLAARRAREPVDDLFSVLLAARVKDDRLAEHEVSMFATTLMSAGSETTYCSLTGGVLALLEHPDQLELLRSDRGLIGTAVSEILRWVTPVTHFARNVVADTEIAGQPIKTGERVVIWYTSANRDEAVFTDPDRFDVTRSVNPHVSFGGGGPHYCIGNGLAALEMRIFLEAVLDRLPDLELLGPPVRTQTNFMNSFKHMPVRFRSGDHRGVRP
jgi:cholest-4-en-3-one 26-monooxygenase